MDREEEVVVVRECSKKILDIVENIPVHLAMGSLSTLLISYARATHESLEEFMGKMILIWSAIRDQEKDRPKEEDAVEKTDL